MRYNWTDSSAYWQVKHGELASGKTESAFRYLEHVINATSTAQFNYLARDLLDIIRELRGQEIEPQDTTTPFARQYPHLTGAELSVRLRDRAAHPHRYGRADTAVLLNAAADLLSSDRSEDQES